MKRLNHKLGIFLIAIAILASCSKGDYNSGDGQKGQNPFKNDGKTKEIPSGKLTAKINGVDFTAKYANSFYSSGGSDSVWTIVGYATDYNKADGFTLVTSDSKTGTYNIGSGVNQIKYTATGSSTTVSASTGSITISEVTESNIKGSFKMSAAGGIEVTEGSFDMPIIRLIDYKIEKKLW